MRRKRCPVPTVDRPNFEISSLVDVSFLLLIFFLVTSVILKKEQELASSIPESKGIPSTPHLVVRVTIEKDGSVFFGEPGILELISYEKGDRKLATLGERIRTLRELTGRRTSFQLKVADSVSHQRFVDVVNCFAKQGVAQIEILDFAHF